MKNPKEILQQYWGFQEFKPAQEQVIESLLDKKDVIALLPTGGGKSICFQLPTLLQPGICIVISPLIALMQDQVEALNKRGIKAVMLGGKIKTQELDQLLDNCIYGNYKFLYLSPERLQQEIVQQRILQMNVNYIAVDEAHCISEWGHDFRPSYHHIKILKNLATSAQIIALTATATKKVIADIQEKLALENPEIIKYSFQRNNIHFLNYKKEDKEFALIDFLKQNEGSGILYVRSRRATLELKEILKQENISAEAYHGGLTAEEKKKHLESWLAGKFSIMVATTAFGMGIDKPDVRTIVHYQIPESLESYFQEAGRAGRDGKESKALLVYNDADIAKLENQFLHILPTPENVKYVYKKLNSYFAIAYGEGQESSFNFNFAEFCATYQLSTTKTYQVLQLLDRAGILNLTPEFHKQLSLRFLISDKHLRYFLNENSFYDPLVKTLLRMYGGFFDHEISVNSQSLSQKTNLSVDKITSVLKELHEKQVIELTIKDQDTTLTFLVPREDDITINPLIPYIKQQFKNKEDKIKAVLNYLENNEICKNIQLLSYFGEEIHEPCGKCSVCLKNKQPTSYSKKELNNIYISIKKELEKETQSSKKLVATLAYSEEIILYVLRVMLENKKIELTKNKTYTLR
ncbi:RecQ family ATP-dependent DNA helicase [Mesonia maritima]|uniref:ATP-dependent DNA helicase RecQ n=1 Tax=Mesonia maritima TaxID=1793873 RepID=A0ABU1K618_9FLAO|nr:RecQ family ATP-dependent DNA helicase [Mesonia maritima]MDR6301053.1 ATP-dependent DNA helicase RecQ [Mesonia maritima]